MTLFNFFVKTIYMNTWSMRILETAMKKPIKEIIEEALESSPDRESAAQLLGISRQTLWDWMRRLNMNGTN